MPFLLDGECGENQTWEIKGFAHCEWGIVSAIFPLCYINPYNNPKLLPNYVRKLKEKLTSLAGLLSHSAEVSVLPW